MDISIAILLVLGLQLVFVPEGFRPKIKCGSACYTDDDVNFNNIGAVKIDTNGDITIYFPTVYSTCVYTSIVYDID